VGVGMGWMGSKIEGMKSGVGIGIGRKKKE